MGGPLRGTGRGGLGRATKRHSGGGGLGRATKRHSGGGVLGRATIRHSGGRGGLGRANKRHSGGGGVLGGPLRGTVRGGGTLIQQVHCFIINLPNHVRCDKLVNYLQEKHNMHTG